MENGPEKHEGYLFKVERSVVGTSRKKFWFVLPLNSPTLYWFKSPSDFNCVGRISLSGAAFTYNPRESGIFEIHVNNEIYILEAQSNKIRIEWLIAFQTSRKRYYDDIYTGNNNSKCSPNTLMHNDEKIPHVGVLKEEVECMLKNANDSGADESKKVSMPVDSVSISTPGCSQSTFYLSEGGELNRHSLDMPEPQFNCAIDDLLSREAQVIEKNISAPTLKIVNKARQSMRRISDKGTQPSKMKCECCQENIETAVQLRNRCYELTDELIASQDLVTGLKRSLITAYNQRDSLAKFCTESPTMEDKLDSILERESALTNLQFTVIELRREIEDFKEENRLLEAENNSLNVVIDAFKESVKTKDELIMKFCGDNPPYDGRSGPPPKPERSFSCRQDEESVVEVPEAILLDFTSIESRNDAKKFLNEASVNDVNEMKDLLDGYCNQNKFLNNEVIELQRIIQSLEDRERKLIRQNFDIEAIYYQLKSRYIMVLNHFRLSMHPRRSHDSSVIQDLIAEIIAGNAHDPTSSGSGKNSIITPIDPNSYAMLLSPYKSLNTLLIPSNVDGETDCLGFYLNSPRSRCPTPLNVLSIGRLGPLCAPNSSESDSEHEEEEGEANRDTDSPLLGEVLLEHSVVDKVDDENTGDNEGEQKQPCTSSTSKVFTPNTDDWMVRIAADLKKRSDDIWENISLASNKEYIEWLQRWDSYLVNHVLQPPSNAIKELNSELKGLIRFGVPHAYRTRIWKSLVESFVGNTQAEMGKGYYECLLKKAEKVRDTTTDAALKQIDLDLGRTLPTNKQFDKESSEKAQALRRVLYAFRFHNKVVEYCQGLNRIAAIGLLYLDEADAFWFLVACVEHLQPENYYSHNLLGAVVDQKVLLDLVQKKIPLLWEHFRRLDVDLSLFTLSWFLTIFVDILTHNIYINIFDVFLYEGNKVLFRFALALLKLSEPKVLECTSLSGVQACLSNLSSIVVDYKTLANIAFNQLNPFSSKTIETKRQMYLNQFKVNDLISNVKFLH